MKQFFVFSLIVLLSATKIIAGDTSNQNANLLSKIVTNTDLVHGAPRKQKRAEILWTKVICKEKDRYIGWPTICARKNGELLAVFSGDRDAHVCPFGKVQMVRSNDQGETWSDPQTVQNSVVDNRDAGIMELQNGDLVLTWFTSICYVGSFPRTHKFAPKGTKAYYYQRHFENLSVQEIIDNIGYFTKRSTDGGKTWEKPVRTYGSANHGGIQLKDGRLLMISRRWGAEGNFHPQDPISKTVKHELTVEESKDNAKSWNKIANLFPGDHTDITLFHEPHVVETASGKLVAQFRCHLKGTPLYQAESTDGGKTWSPMRQLPIHGLPPHLICLADNKLLTVYGRRFGDYGEYGCISDDEGKTWDVENEIKITGHFNNDLGYPASVQLKDGFILTVYYQAENPGEKTALMATKWCITQ